ncbi:MAG TPA: hypothetical protein VGI22_03835 [Xanthobacteraceae bacterium]
MQLLVCGPLRSLTLVPRRHKRRLLAGVVPLTLGGLCGMMLSAPEASATCTPAIGDNVTVTCTGTTTNQGPGVNTGYGNGTQNGLNLTVVSGASVNGVSALGATGIDANNNNTMTV